MKIEFDFSCQGNLIFQIFVGNVCYSLPWVKGDGWSRVFGATGLYFIRGLMDDEDVWFI